MSAFLCRGSSEPDGATERDSPVVFKQSAFDVMPIIVRTVAYLVRHLQKDRCETVIEEWPFQMCKVPS